MRSALSALESPARRLTQPTGPLGSASNQPVKACAKSHAFTLTKCAQPRPRYFRCPVGEKAWPAILPTEEARDGHVTGTSNARRKCAGGAARPRGADQIWIGLPRTANAASLIASEWVGCAWQV